MVQPEVLTFEFVMDPSQHHVALLPEILREFQLDFKHQTEAGSLFRPAIDVRLILGRTPTIGPLKPARFPNQQHQIMCLKMNH